MRHFLIALLLVIAPSTAVADEKKLRDTPSDQAVQKALEFLATAQDKTDGAWRLNAQKSPAATGLAVMAFLSAGHVPGEGKYGEAIE
jgi:hypothetical protein